MFFKIHREGRKIIRYASLSLGLVMLLFTLLVEFEKVPAWLGYSIIVIFLVLYFLIAQFFRNPERKITKFDDNTVYAPADGKVVVIEETEETEYFKDKRIQVSIFMSPINVHVNRAPIGGKVNFSKYHPGKYLVAWHPKSSTENERTTVVISNGKQEVLLRQIAGAVARRIINYLKVGQTVKQGQDYGFIRFGSRVDLFLPLDTDIKISIGDVVKGNKTVLAKLK